MDDRVDDDADGGMHVTGGQYEYVGVMGSQRAGGNIYNVDARTGEASAKPRMNEIRAEELKWYKSVFVEPKGYLQPSTKALGPKDHILLVHGANGAGKLTCAVNLAFCLLRATTSEAPIVLYERRAEEKKVLLSAIQELALKGPAVVILEDAFDKNISLLELSRPGVTDLRRALRVGKLYLILTTEKEEGELLRLPFPKVDATPVAMRPIFDRHLDLSEKVGAISAKTVGIAKSCWDQLLKILLLPAQIQSFCDRLAQRAPSTSAEILEIARQVSKADRAARGLWFNALSSNAQLLATVSYLSKGAARRTVESIYLASTLEVRTQGGTWLSDPESLGLDDLLVAIEAHESGGRIEFNTPAAEDAVAEQVSNRRHLLWSLIERLIGRAGGEGGDLTSPGTHAALGAALGRLARQDAVRFGRLVREVAGDPPRSGIAVFALVQSVRCDPEQAFRSVLGITRSWAREREPRLLSIGAMALGEAFRALDQLTAQGWAQDGGDGLFNGAAESLLILAISGAERRDVARALALIGRVDASRTTSFLSSCLSLQDRKIREVAKSTIARIFLSLRRSKAAPNKTKFAPLLGLIGPLLEACGADARAVRELFLTLAVWVERADWRADVLMALLEVANLGTARARQRLRAALAASWLRREPWAGYAYAQALIARSYAMDGALMDPPGFGHALLLVDPKFFDPDGVVQGGAGEESSKRLERPRPRENAFRHLWGLLDAQVETAVGCLGERGTAPPVDSELDPGAPRPAYAVPRLMMPAIERRAQRDTGLVVVVTCGELWDLDDALGRPWSKGLFVAVAGDEVRAPEGIDPIRLDDGVSPASMAVLECRLRIHWARSLVMAPRDEWWFILQSFEVDLENLETNPWDCLGRWADLLGSWKKATGRTDLARRSLCALGWWASFDLQSCVRLLRDWMLERGEKDDPVHRRALASAGAKMLFTMHSAHAMEPSGSAPGILFQTLAHPLAETSRDGVEAVLAAVRRWVEDPTWSAYLAGDVQDGRGRLLRWAEKFKPEDLPALAAALPRLDEAVASALAADAAQAMAAALARIRQQIALGPPLTLPALEGNELYVLIVLDAAEADTALRNRLAALACELFQALRKPGLRAAIFRLGERAPAWVARAVVPASADLMPPVRRSPRLLGPLLSKPQLSPDQVRHVLVLAAKPVIDLDDWLASEWRNRLVFFRGDLTESRRPEFAELPPPVGESAKAIVGYLRPA
jgi:hypothetical protein